MRKFLSATLITLATVGALALPLPAEAGVHLIHVTEIFGGTSAHPDAQYVELRLEAPGQVFTAGSAIYAYDTNANFLGVFAQFDRNLFNGADGARFVACTTKAMVVYGMTCDAIAQPILGFSTGSIYFTGSGDFVPYGNYQGPVLPNTSPAPALVRGRSIERTTDTANPGVDFHYASPSPTANNNLGAAPVALATTLDNDLDTVRDGTDNCPDHANTNQADADGDGLGDACDA